MLFDHLTYAFSQYVLYLKRVLTYLYSSTAYKPLLLGDTSYIRVYLASLSIHNF